MSTNMQSSGNTARIEVIGGQPVVFVGDRMFALPAVSTTNSTTPEPPTAEVTMKQASGFNSRNAHSQGALPGVPFGPPLAQSLTPFSGLDLPTLKTQQALKKQELRAVEQNEVLQASHQSETWRANMIEKKRCLIIELDALRKQITTLEADKSASSAPTSYSFGSAGSATMPTFAAPFQPPLSQAMYALPNANPYTPIMLYQPPPFSSFPSFPTVESDPMVPTSTDPPRSPGSASRRSHAIEIKPPREEVKKQPVTVLDPKSPTYEPASASDSNREKAPPSPSPPKRSLWRSQQTAQFSEHGYRAASPKPSLSSIDTTDFFPTNTHEYSSTRVAPRTTDDKPSSKENVVVPSTPEKHWPASPWNEGHSSVSRNNGSTQKLSLWPEDFGKPPFSAALRQDTGPQNLSTMLEQTPLTRIDMTSSAASSNVMPRAQSDQRIVTEETWPFEGAATKHAPSTYQEGYQAGYDYAGKSVSLEVLQGYLQGLMHFVSDDAKKRQTMSSTHEVYERVTQSRTPSLRGLVAESMAHKPSVNMNVDQPLFSNGLQESVRLDKHNLPLDSRCDSMYSSQKYSRDEPPRFAFRKEDHQETSQRVISMSDFAKPTGLLPGNNMACHRQATSSPSGNDMDQRTHEGTIRPRADLSSNGGNTQKIWGSQLEDRTNFTPLSMQRFYPTIMEMHPRNLSKDMVAPSRPFASQRLSGLDGAMDDMAEMMEETQIGNSQAVANEKPATTPNVDEVGEMEEEVNASCFRPSGGKGKQKVVCSPDISTGGRSKTASSPANTPSSPKKSGEHSPAKARLEQVTNKFRRAKKDDPRAMSPEDRMKRSDKWRQRFQQLKKTEIEEIEAHRNNSRT